MSDGQTAFIIQASKTKTLSSTNLDIWCLYIWCLYIWCLWSGDVYLLLLIIFLRYIVQHRIYVLDRTEEFLFPIRDFIVFTTISKKLITLTVKDKLLTLSHSFRSLIQKTLSDSGVWRCLPWTRNAFYSPLQIWQHVLLLLVCDS